MTTTKPSFGSIGSMATDGAVQGNHKLDGAGYSRLMDQQLNASSDSSMSELVEFASQPLVKPSAPISSNAAAAAQKRRKRRRKHYRVQVEAGDGSGSGRGGGGGGGGGVARCCGQCHSCWSLTQLVSQLFCVVAVLALLFWSYHIREQMDILDQYFTSVKAGNKNFDHDVVSVKARLDTVETLVSAGASGPGGLHDITRRLNAVIAQMKLLNTSSSHIQASLAAAPELRDLPDTVKSLQKGAASQGSDLSSVHIELNELQSAQKEAETDRQQLAQQITQLMMLVNGSDLQLSSSSDSGGTLTYQHTMKDTGSDTHLLQQQFHLLQDVVSSVNITVHSVNTSLWQRMLTIQEIIDKQQLSIFDVSNQTRLLKDSITSPVTSHPTPPVNSDNLQRVLLDEIHYNLSALNQRVTYLESDLNSNLLSAQTRAGFNDVVSQALSTWSERQGVDAIRGAVRELSSKVDSLETRQLQAPSGQWASSSTADTAAAPPRQPNPTQRRLTPTKTAPSQRVSTSRSTEMSGKSSQSSSHT